MYEHNINPKMLSSLTLNPKNPKPCNREYRMPALTVKPWAKRTRSDSFFGLGLGFSV